MGPTAVGSESEAVLKLLYRHIETNTRFHCRVRWQPNTLVLWDNRAVHHHAVWDYYPETRRDSARGLTFNDS